jgi:hypothetical protein
MGGGPVVRRVPIKATIYRALNVGATQGANKADGSGRRRLRLLARGNPSRTRVKPSATPSLTPSLIEGKFSPSPPAERGSSVSSD